MKSVIYALVEGKSDATALRRILECAFPGSWIEIGIFGGDITTELAGDSDNHEKRIIGFIQDHADRKHTFKMDDIATIIMVTDLDGCYIPDEAIIQSHDYKGVVYHDDGIYTDDRCDIKKRNNRKRKVINLLVGLTSIDGIPFEIYFMSRNLDHVLYGRPNINENDKICKAKRFVREHRTLESLEQFFDSILGDMPNNYQESWDYVRTAGRLRSLERHTNIGLLLNHAHALKSGKGCVGPGFFDVFSITDSRLYGRSSS